MADVATGKKMGAHKENQPPCALDSGPTGIPAPWGPQSPLDFIRVNQGAKEEETPTNPSWKKHIPSDPSEVY